MEFGDLHSHTDYSIFDGFAKIEEKISRAKELGYTALAMTDHGTTTGLVPFYKECKKQGIKPILGYEGYFCLEPDVPAGETYHILLLAKDIVGYRNILKISTYASEHFYRKPRLGIDILRECHEGVIVSTACVGGIRNVAEWDSLREELRGIFGEDFYLEIQPHDFPEQVTYNNDVVEESKRTGIPCLVTLDSHYVNKDDDKYHKLWIGLGEDSDYYSSCDFHLQSKDEIKEKLNYIDKDFLDSCFSTVSEVIGKCNVEIPFGEHHYPIYPTPDAEKYIRNRLNEGWKERNMIALPNRRKYIDQVEHEMQVLKKCDYLNYFCIIDDMLHHCREEGIPTGLGRGSVGGSCVAYLMKITDVDPLKHKLVFERFANPERVTSPDIDVDIASNRRDEVIDYIRQKYGEVYQIRTVNYIQERGAVQRAGQALGMKPSEINKISTNLTSLDFLDQEDLKTISKRFLGHIQSFGMHASAVLVFPESPTHWCAIEKQKGNFVAAQDYVLLEEQGLLKLDILGLETLCVIADTLEKIDEPFSLDEIPDDDKETILMLRRGDTEGCFQIESDMMTRIIRTMKIEGIEDLMTVTALGRPGPLDSGMVDTFLERRNGAKVVYPHEKLKPVLEDTEGVILYQEQIMQIARVLCGYTYGQADTLRRIIGKKKEHEVGPAVKKMIDAAVKNGVDRKVITEITDSILAFANYCFNRSHSAAYGKTSWITAYLKSHYTAEFMASLMDSVCGDKPKLVGYILHAQKLGVEVLPPNIKTGKTKCTVDNGKITLGFSCIMGVGNSSIENGSDNLAEYMEANPKYNKTIYKNLVKAGCFKGDRNELLEYVDWAKDKRKSKPQFQFSGEEKLSNSRMEIQSIGYSFENIFAKYDISITDNINKFAVEILDVSPRKTKKGKPMAFIKARTMTDMMNLVIFNSKYKELEKGEVYIVRLKDTMITDFMKAKKKSSA